MRENGIHTMCNVNSFLTSILKTKGKISANANELMDLTVRYLLTSICLMIWGDHLLRAREVERIEGNLRRLEKICI